MSVRILLNALNELKKIDKLRGCTEHHIVFPQATILINLIISEHKCNILFII